MDKKISFCITDKNYRYSYLSRVADFENEEFKIYSDTENKFSSIEDYYATSTIGIHPNEAYPGELCVWEWEPREDAPYNKQLSYRTEIPFFLLLTPGTHVQYKDDVSKLLKGGFYVPEYLPESFFLKINSQKDNYRVLYLLKKDLIIRKQKAYISENIDTVKCFLIPKKHFIEISNKSEFNKEVNLKLYKYLKLPENYEKEWPVKTFEEQLRSFFNRYAKQNDASRNVRHHAMELLDDFVKNKEEIKAFFANMGCYDDSINEKITELQPVISTYLSDDGYANRVIAAMVENNEKIKEKYIQHVKKDWFETKDEQRRQLKSEIKHVKEKLNKINKEYSGLCEQKTIIEEDIAKLISKKSKIKNQITEFEGSFKSKIKNARKDMSDFLSDLIIYQGMNNETGNSLNTNSLLIRRSVDKLEYDEEVIDILETDDLLFLIEENLQRGGISEDYNLVAQYALYSVFTRVPLLLFGGNAREFANGLSVSVCAMPADVLTLPPSFDNLVKLEKEINKSESDVVLIENAVLGCDESVYLPLVKEKTKKILLFSVDFSQNMSLLPKNMLHYMNLLDLNGISDICRGEYIKPVIVNKPSQPEIPDGMIRGNKRVLKEFSKSCNLTSTYISQRSHCMAFMDSLNDKAFDTLLLCELIPFFKSQGKKEEIQQFIDDNEFPGLKRNLSASNNLEVLK